jgi:hypothetical protein
MPYQLRNRRDRLVLETDDMARAYDAFWARSRRGWSSKLYQRAIDGSWMLAAWGVHDFRPHRQERDKAARISAAVAAADRAP